MQDACVWAAMSGFDQKVLVATLWERTRHSKHRPLLQAPDPFARVQELYTMRDALYRDVADAVVESDREQLSRLAHRLEQQLRAAAGA